MKEYKKDFISFLMESKALKFGEFTLKSGRLSPYFLNTGMLHTGKAINKLGSFYASSIVDNIGSDFSAVFGPAYKGIPLAIATVNSLYAEHNLDVDYAFNRKEAKDHGDKGLIVGKILDNNDRLVIVDDVITAGTAIRETIELLKVQGNPELKAVIVSVDRMEKGTGEKSAIQEISESTGLKFFPIVNILDIIEFLQDPAFKHLHQVDEALIAKMLEYRKQYGVS